MERLKDAYLVPWEESEGLQGLALDWMGAKREAHPIGGPAAEDREIILVSRQDGQRILVVVNQARGWGDVGSCYQRGRRHVIELPTIIIEWE